jgi:hypothetical protein
MSKLKLVIENTKHPDPDPPAGAAAIRPFTKTKAVGRWQGENDNIESWPYVLGVAAPPEDDIISYSDYRKDLVWQALAKIAEKRGVDIQVRDFKERKDELLGICVNDLFAILINELVPNWYKPRVLAHELAHFQLHKNLNVAAYRNDVIYYLNIELEAKKFAERLLRFVRHRLPKPQLPPGYKSINTSEGWNELARRREEEALERSKHLMYHPEDASNEAELDFVHTIQRIAQGITKEAERVKEAA